MPIKLGDFKCEPLIYPSYPPVFPVLGLYPDYKCLWYACCYSLWDYKQSDNEDLDKNYS